MLYISVDDLKTVLSRHPNWQRDNLRQEITFFMSSEPSLSPNISLDNLNKILDQHPNWTSDMLSAEIDSSVKKNASENTPTTYDRETVKWMLRIVFNHGFSSGRMTKVSREASEEKLILDNPELAFIRLSPLNKG